MKLTLLRHGITEGNKRGLYYGSTDLPLLDEGIAELESRKASGGYPTAGRYYTSTMLRTQQTLGVLYGQVEYEALYGLREMDFGVFEMRTVEELKQDPVFQCWANEKMVYNVCPGGESFIQVQQRALEAIATVLAQDEDAVCVVHGGVISTLMNTWFPPETGYFNYMPLPGTGYQVTFEDGKPVAMVEVPMKKA